MGVGSPRFIEHVDEGGFIVRMYYRNMGWCRSVQRYGRPPDVARHGPDAMAG